MAYSKITDEIMDAKSVCCNADIVINQKMTCGNYCHEKYIIKMIKEFGRFKKIIDQTSGIAYKIPTRVIIEEGLKQEELKNYPTW